MANSPVSAGVQARHNTQRCIVMLGTDFTAPGGITAVVRAYRDGGLFGTWPIRFLPTYRRNTALDKLKTAGGALLRFVSWLLRGQVACVHAHVAARGSFWRKSAFLMLGRLAGVRTIFHLHDGSFPAWFDTRPAAVRAIVRAVLRHVDRVVVLTPGWGEWVRGTEPKARTCVVGNPLPIPPAVSTREPWHVLFLGRLWPEKGVFDLLEAITPLAQSHGNLQLVCAGDGDLEGARARARALGIAQQLHLPGWVDGETKAALLRRAAVFVLPSYFEGLPMGVLEAMAYGIPVVATSVGGIPDAIGHDAGMLVPVGDIAALGRALALLLGDMELQARMSAAGRQRAMDSFATEKVLATLGGLYRELGLEPAAPADQNARQLPA